jgi:hypothetical protein
MCQSDLVRVSEFQVNSEIQDTGHRTPYNIVGVIAMAMTPPSTTRRSRIYPVLIIIIVVKCLTPIEWSNSLEFACCVLPAGWLHNLCLEIIRTIPKEMLAGAVNLP